MQSIYKILLVPFIAILILSFNMANAASKLSDSNVNDLKKSLRNLFPNEKIGVERVNNSVALTGLINEIGAVEPVLNVASKYVAKEDIINLLQVKNGKQVMLKVKVGELKKTALGKLGIGTQGIISGGNGVIGALEQDKIFKVLAEPNLTSISGKPAEFLAGGEFPVPVSKNDDVTIEYKPFGVNIKFTPHILSDNRIRIDVGSEISELSEEGSVRVRNISIPSISTRRATTTIELAPGESYMIAGLITDNFQSAINDVPALGKIPLINALFRSSDFKRNESELVIAVTPYLVDPTDGKSIRTPVDNLSPASNLEMMFMGKLGKFNNDNSANNINNMEFEARPGFIIE